MQGKWVYKLNVSGPAWVNTIRATALSGTIGVASGAVPLNPASIPVTGGPGANGVVEVCAFDATAAASGKPYNCCRSRITLTIPRNICGDQQ